MRKPTSYRYGRFLTSIVQCQLHSLVPRPSPFFVLQFAFSIILPCIILNTNRRTKNVEVHVNANQRPKKTGEAWERGYQLHEFLWWWLKHSDESQPEVFQFQVCNRELFCIYAGAKWEATKRSLGARENLDYLCMCLCMHAETFWLAPVICKAKILHCSYLVAHETSSYRVDVTES